MNVTVGILRYPVPIQKLILIVDIPAESVTSIDVAAAPTPNVVDPIPAIVDAALTIETVGATVYPAPGLMSNISLTENTLLTDVVIATAVASVPPAGAVVIATVGV